MYLLLKYRPYRSRFLLSSSLKKQTNKQNTFFFSFFWFQLLFLLVPFCYLETNGFSTQNNADTCQKVMGRSNIVELELYSCFMILE